MKLSEAIKIHAAHEGIELRKQTSRGYIHSRMQFALHMRNPLMEQISDVHVVNYFQTMIELGWDNNTIRTHSTALSNLFKYWFKRGYKCMNPDLLPMPEKSYKMPKVATEEDLEKVLSVIDGMMESNGRAGTFRDKAALLLIAESGCRNGEACSLNIEDVDFANKRASLKTEKSKGLNPFRNIYWHTEKCSKAIELWMMERKRILNKIMKSDENALFIGTRGGQVGKRIIPATVAIQLRKYSRIAGLEMVLNAHSLRHRVGRDLAKKRVNNSIISGILGHSDMNSSKIYTALENNELEDQYRDLYGH